MERLFKHLGVAYDMTALTNIEDFNYLAFFSTACKYDTKSTSYFQISNLDKINQWLSDRGCGGQIAFDFENKEQPAPEIPETPEEPETQEEPEKPKKQSSFSRVWKMIKDSLSEDE